jgi:type VI secretion system secreted protein VgrG
MLAITAHLAFQPLGDDCTVIRLDGSEGVNELSSWRVRVCARSGDADLEKALGTPAEIRLKDDGEDYERVVPLIAAEITYEGETREGHIYVLSLVPVEWYLTQRSGYRVFQAKTTQEIVSTLLKDSGIDGPAVVFRLSGTYVSREYCVQYDEREWSFCERLLADDGISYWFDVADGKPTIVFGDDPHSHDGIEVPTVVRFVDPGGLVSARHFHELELSDRIVTEGVHIRDYDVRAPDVLIEGKAGKNASAAPEYFEFPACVPSIKVATARAKVRLEQLQRHQQEAQGASDCVRIQSGRRLTVDGAADAAFNQDYLVVRVHHVFASASSTGEQQGDSYRNTVFMTPLKATAYRPAPPEFAPKVTGIETAVTTGPAGEEIHVDDLASVKVRFPWDRSGVMDDKSSTWVRTMQMAMGGAMLLPRVGWEVPVMYADGNPDRPIVLGRVYNAQGVVPYPLPGGSATTSLQSATSPGGGSTNEIRMGDSGGSQEVFVHASKDQSVFVGGSRKTSVGANQTHDVKLSYGVDVKASQTHTVGASQTVNVSTQYSTKIAGARSESVGALEAWKIGANRVCDAAGAYTEVIGAVYALQCNQANTDVKGGYAQIVGAKMGHTCGLGFSDSVAGARGIHVGGSRSIVAGKAYSEAVTGIKKVSAGASSVKAASVKTVGKATGKVKAASADIKAGDAITIGAPEITIQAGGSITCPGMTIGGGELKLAKGTTAVLGTIKRQGGTEIE